MNISRSLILGAIVFGLAACNGTTTDSTTTSDSTAVAIPAPIKADNASTTNTTNNTNVSIGDPVAVISAFRQGHSGDFNCASVAVIKCAIATFGISNIFKSIIESPNAYSVVLRNGDSVGLDKSELALAKTMNGFLLLSNKAIFDTAQFMYAVMAKNAAIAAKTAQNAGERSVYTTDFKKNLELLHDEASTTNLPILLGLEFDYIKWRSRETTKSFVFFNGYHAVYGTMGKFDDYGEPAELTERNFKNHRTLNLFKSLEKNVFVLTDIK